MKKLLLEKKVWCCGKHHTSCCDQHYEWMCFNTCNDEGYGGNYMANGKCRGGSPNPQEGTCGSYTPGGGPRSVDDYEVDIKSDSDINTNKNFKMNKMNKRNIKLKESDLINLIKKVITEKRQYGKVGYCVTRNTKQKTFCRKGGSVTNKFKKVQCTSDADCGNTGLWTQPNNVFTQRDCYCDFTSGPNTPISNNSNSK